MKQNSGVLTVCRHGSVSLLAAISALAVVHVGSAQAAGAATLADPAALRVAAETAVRKAAGSGSARLGIAVAALDPRLQLNQCASAPQGFIAGDGQLHDFTTVGVRCEAPVRWTLYLRVALSTRTTVLVARRSLPRDTPALPTDFEATQRTVPGLEHRYIGEAGQLEGRRLRRPVNVGDALTVDMLAVTPVIRRGQQVTVLARTTGMEIRMSAIALGDGAPTERISVRNLASNRVIEGIVVDAGVVEVSL